MKPRYSPKRDENEAEIVDKLEGAGFWVYRLNGASGLPDLLVFSRGARRAVFIEVKVNAKAKARKSETTKAQKDFASSSPLKVFTVSTYEEFREQFNEWVKG